ncbi:MAG: AMP-binding protein [Acidimicrobiales bacterium]
MIGGEALGSSLAARCYERFPELQLFTSYGPTEAAIECMLHRAQPGELSVRPEVPIGAPSNGVSLLLLDTDGNRVPIGGLGEICISHVGLTEGYLGEPTPQLSHPFFWFEDQRYYRTGDLARLVDDGTLVYQGRADTQVKVGGIRLEPVEVEGALESHPGVAKAAVRLLAGTEGTPQLLTAWFVPAGAGQDDPIAAVELRSFLAQSLPAHAIPVAFVEVDRIPVTTNGKLDERALPAPRREHRVQAGGGGDRPSESEREIIVVWEQLLGVDPIGVHDDFFVLGGDSLAAMHMMVSVGEVVGRVISEDLAFVHTTPRSLAAAIELASSLPTSLTTPVQVTHPADVPRPSAGESAILLDEALAASPGRYNVGHLFVVPAELDEDRFFGALIEAASMHVPLSWTHGRTRRRLADDQMVERCDPEPPVAPADLPAVLERWHRPPMDPANGPLIRCAVQPLDDGRTAVLLVIHHVAIDAEGTRLLWNQLDILYHGGTVERPTIDYPSFAAWQESTITDADSRFWSSLDYPSSSWMFDRPDSAAADGYVNKRAGFTAADLGESQDATGFSVMLAALAVASSRRMDADSVGVGVVASTRNHPLADSLVGYFLNTLPLIVECPPHDSFAGVARSASMASRRALAHRTYPYADVVKARRERGDVLPRIDVMLAYDNAGHSSFGGQAVEDRVLFNGSAVADTATLFVNVDGSNVDLSMEFSGARMSRAQAEEFLADVEAVARAGLAEPETLVGDVSLPSDGSSLLLGREVVIDELVWPAISGQIHKCSEQLAVICGSEALSWSRLGTRSVELAMALVEAGVEPGERVALCLPRSGDLIAGIVACLRLGVSYVPVDPTYPSERKRLIARKAGAKVGLVSDNEAVTNLDLDPGHIRRPADPAELPTWNSLDGDAEAYVMFTSGSTGEPRGVPVSVRQLAGSTAARTLAYEGHPGRFLLVSSLSFDSSVAGLFWTLFSGGTVILPTEDQVRDPEALLGLISDCQVSHTLVVPTLYSALLERGEDQLAWPSQVIVAGEACPKALVDRHFRLRPGSRLANEYGPTEATVWSTLHHCSPDDADTPIGKPIPGVWVEIVDPSGKPVPQGIRGELIVGGPGVVAGYLEDPTASLARFGEGDLGRFFRTGDAAAVVDGAVVYRGRLDNQLNVGGVRAEPEEIEAAILRDQAIGAAIVIATDPRSLDDLVGSADPAELARLMTASADNSDPAAFLEQELRAASDQQQLVAHLEPAPGASIDLKLLKAALRDQLPAGLQPRKLVVHDELSRTANGKLDREAAASLSVATEESSVSDNEVDNRVLGQVMSHFQEVLGVSDVGPDESLFDLGGHSLIALRLLDRIEETSGVRLAVAELYQRPTPRGVADLLDGLDVSSHRQEFVVDIQPEGTRPPIFGVHVLGRNGLYYRPLSEALGPDQPVFGLGIASALEDATAPTEVARISAIYADEVERVAPRGPVVLAAVSIGSSVAFELADHLAARGREVALVALFDAAGPASTNGGSTRVRRHLRQLRDHPVSYFSARFARVGMRSKRRLERMEKRVREVLGLQLPDRLRIRGFVEANVHAAAAYVVTPRHHPMVVFRAVEDPFGHGRGDGTMGWGETARGGLEVIDCPGGHVSMLAQPHVEILAGELQNAIDQAISSLKPTS